MFPPKVCFENYINKDRSQCLLKSLWANLTPFIAEVVLINELFHHFTVDFAVTGIKDY